MKRSTEPKVWWTVAALVLLAGLLALYALL